MECEMDKVGRNCSEKINGKYWMYYLADAQGKDSQMGVAYSADLLHWTEALDTSAGEPLQVV